MYADFFNSPPPRDDFKTIHRIASQVTLGYRAVLFIYLVFIAIFSGMLIFGGGYISAIVMFLILGLPGILIWRSTKRKVYAVIQNGEICTANVSGLGPKLAPYRSLLLEYYHSPTKTEFQARMEPSRHIKLLNPKSLHIQVLCYPKIPHQAIAWFGEELGVQFLRQMPKKDATGFARFKRLLILALLLIFLMGLPFLHLLFGG